MIRENCLVQWDGSVDQIERILWIEAEKDRYHSILIAEDQRAWPVMKKLTDLHLALENRRALVLQRDHVAARLRLESAMTEKQRQLRDMAWQTIVDLVHDPEKKVFDAAVRGKLIKATASQKGVNHTTVYKYLRRYWQRGQTRDALQPDLSKCGGPGKQHTPGDVKLGRPRVHGQQDGMNMTDADRENCFKVVKKYYKSKQLNLRLTYERLLSEHYISGYEDRNGTPVPVLKPEAERPTFSQFRYYVNTHFGRMELERSREGELNYQRNLRPVLGDQTRLAEGPGDIYQIDATTADIYLVHSIQTGLVVGRPIVYMVVDTFSQMVVGLHVTFHNASYNAAAMAIWNAYLDKVEFCNKYGLPIQEDEWPVQGIPQQLYADRGEMVCTQTNHLVASLGLRIANTPPYRADAKGIVERSFRTMNQIVVNWLPGALPDNFEERGQPDYRKQAQLTKDDFTQALLIAVLQYNKSLRDEYIPTRAMMRDNIITTPLNIWNWGIKHCCKLKDMDRTAVRFRLLPADKATVTRHGYYFSGLYYTSSLAVEREVFSSAEYGTKTVDISYDPNLMDNIYVHGKTVDKFWPCHLSDAYRPYAGLTKAEVTALMTEDKRKAHQQRDVDVGTSIQSQAQIDAIKEEARRRKMLDGQIDIKQLKEAMDLDRKLEAQQLAAETLGDISLKAPIQQPEPPRPKKSCVPDEYNAVFGKKEKLNE